MDLLDKKMEQVQSVKKQLEEKRIGQGTLEKYLRRPESEWKDMVEHLPELGSVDEQVAQQVVYDIKYAGYLNRQQTTIERQQRLAMKAIPEWLNYDSITHLRMEAREKFNKIRPANLDQAGRISGITPADISVLMLHLEKGSKS